MDFGGTHVCDMLSKLCFMQLNEFVGILLNLFSAPGLRRFLNGKKIICWQSTFFSYRQLTDGHVLSVWNC